MKFKAARAGALPNDPQTLHALRVAAKKLRYSLDAARSIIGAAPKTEIQRLRQFQTRLGQMRDMQILKDNFQRWQLQNTATDELSFPPEMTEKFTASLRI
jgi:CHAD domain-containing protein